MAAEQARQVELLESFQDVIRIRAQAGQFVFYSRHIPPGLFLVLAGSVAVLRGGGREDLPALGTQDAAGGAFFVPALEELDQPAGAGVVVQREAEMLFIPRSLALGATAVRRFLENEGRFPALSLR
jgi:hypothetical protein